MKLYLLERVSYGDVTAIALVRSADEKTAREEIAEKSGSESWRGYSIIVTEIPDQSGPGVLLYDER